MNTNINETIVDEFIDTVLGGQWDDDPLARDKARTAIRLFLCGVAGVPALCPKDLMPQYLYGSKIRQAVTKIASEEITTVFLTGESEPN